MTTYLVFSKMKIWQVNSDIQVEGVMSVTRLNSVTESDHNSDNFSKWKGKNNSIGLVA